MRTTFQVWKRYEQHEYEAAAETFSLDGAFYAAGYPDSSVWRRAHAGTSAPWGYWDDERRTEWLITQKCVAETLHERVRLVQQNLSNGFSGFLEGSVCFAILLVILELVWFWRAPESFSHAQLFLESRFGLRMCSEEWVSRCATCFFVGGLLYATICAWLDALVDRRGVPVPISEARAARRSWRRAATVGVEDAPSWYWRIRGTNPWGSAALGLASGTGVIFGGVALVLMTLGGLAMILNSGA